MKIGFIGLGKMGSRMASKLLKEGHEVVVWNRSPQGVEKFKVQSSKFKVAVKNLKIAETVKDLIEGLEKPRLVWLMLPAGEATQSILDEVSKLVEKGDIVIDGGNANFEDTQTRFEIARQTGIRYLGIGVSGGIIAFENGYPLMVGGDKSAYKHIISILNSLASPNGGHEYFGTGGAGHFVKMVHNAIEYGIMQSIGEGFGILEGSPYNLDLLKIAKLYQKGTLVSGFMMERAVEVLEKDPKLSKVTGVIGKASGETIWAVDFAHKNDLPVEIINRSLEIRNESEEDPKIQKSFAARLVASLRHAFGGHEVKKK